MFCTGQQQSRVELEKEIQSIQGIMFNDLVN